MHTTRRTEVRPPRLIGLVLATVVVLPLLVAAPLVAAPAGEAPTPGATVPEPGPAAADGVRPIDWAAFDRTPVDDADAERIRQILLNSNRYALTTWWQQHFAGQLGDYLDFGGTGEHQIRHPAAEAFALATALQTRAYVPARVGVPREVARSRAVRLAESLAYRHLANSADGWSAPTVGRRGGEPGWQSALWAAMAGFAGWQLWDHLDPTGREYVTRMVAYEANRFLGYEVPYWRDADGTEQFPGDSKAEDNSWNAMLLQLATAMLPDHPNWSAWMDKNLELMLSAFARPQDLTSDEVYHGRPLSEWLRGYNVTDDGLVINHGIVHPDYMTTAPQNAHAALTYSLAGRATPAAALHNIEVVYEALVDLDFASPPYEPPGGTMYIDRSDTVYYPEGTDWGTSRRANFFAMDVVAGELDQDGTASTRARTWERLHASAALAMQRRHDDGRTYAPGDDDIYRGREEWVAMHAAWSYLLKWLVDQRAVRFTNTASDWD